jgi:hypothetical protein
VCFRLFAVGWSHSIERNCTGPDVFGIKLILDVSTLTSCPHRQTQWVVFIWNINHETNYWLPDISPIKSDRLLPDLHRIFINTGQYSNFDGSIHKMDHINSILCSTHSTLSGWMYVCGLITSTERFSESVDYVSILDFASDGIIDSDSVFIWSHINSCLISWTETFNWLEARNNYWQFIGQCLVTALPT